MYVSSTDLALRQQSSESSEFRIAPTNVARVSMIAWLSRQICREYNARAFASPHIRDNTYTASTGKQIKHIRRVTQVSTNCVHY